MNCGIELSILAKEQSISDIKYSFDFELFFQDPQPPEGNHMPTINHNLCTR